MEITLVHILSIIGSLSAVCVALWKALDFYAKREMARYDKNEIELSEVRGQHITLLQELARIEGRVTGQHEMSEKVLNHISELNNKNELS